MGTGNRIPAVILWGTGNTAQNFLMGHPDFLNTFSVVGITDNDSGKWGTVFNGFFVAKPEELLQRQFDFVVILSIYATQIEQQLKEKHNISDENILGIDEAYQLNLRYVHGIPKQDYRKINEKHPIDDWSGSVFAAATTRKNFNNTLDYIYLKEKMQHLLPELEERFSYDGSRAEEMVGMNPKEVNLWVCWLQGWDKAPEIVKSCIASIRRNVEGKFHFITYENYAEFVKLPSYIVEKHKEGIIDCTHFSDILRVALLYQYGGIWLDATIYMMDKGLPWYVYQLPLFMYRRNADWDDGYNDPRMFCNWFISASEKNQLMGMMLGALSEYWRDEEECEYCVFHNLMRILWKSYREPKKDWLIVPHNNARLLVKRLNDKYDFRLYRLIANSSRLQKLSYKGRYQDRGGTFYQRLIIDDGYERAL